MDGQFDDCDLTLRDLNLIVESISKSVTSLYHTRIAYPGDEKKKKVGKIDDTTGTVPASGDVPKEPPGDQEKRA